ncbi:unnamed protein product, partial [marine sediment metagenome]
EEQNQDKPMRMSNLNDFISKIKLHVASGIINPDKWTRWGIGWGIRSDDDTYPLYRHLNQARRRMFDLEKISSLCEILGLSNYPKSEINEDWGKILFGRDHSNLAYIGAINDESYSDIARQAEARIRGLLADRLTKLANIVNYSRAGIPVLIFNTLNWKRTEPVELQLLLPTSTYKAIDASGSEVPLQIISSKDIGPGKTIYRFLLMAINVPPMGYNVFYIVPGVSYGSTDLSSGAGTIENKYYRIVVNNSGFQSIYDKE